MRTVLGALSEPRTLEDARDHGGDARGCTRLACRLDGRRHVRSGRRRQRVHLRRQRRRRLGHLPHRLGRFGGGLGGGFGHGRTQPFGVGGLGFVRGHLLGRIGRNRQIHRALRLRNRLLAHGRGGGRDLIRPCGGRTRARCRLLRLRHRRHLGRLRRRLGSPQSMCGGDPHAPGSLLNCPGSLSLRARLRRLVLCLRCLGTLRGRLLASRLHLPCKLGRLLEHQHALPRDGAIPRLLGRLEGLARLLEHVGDDRVHECMHLRPPYLVALELLITACPAHA